MTSKPSQRRFVNLAYNGGGSRLFPFLGTAAELAARKDLEIGRVFGMSVGSIPAALLAAGADADFIKDAAMSLSLDELVNGERPSPREMLRNRAMRTLDGPVRALDQHLRDLGVHTLDDLPAVDPSIAEFLPPSAPWKLVMRTWLYEQEGKSGLRDVGRLLRIGLSNFTSVDVKSKSGRAQETKLLHDLYSLPIPEAIVLLHMQRGLSQSEALRKVGSGSVAELAAPVMAMPVLFPAGRFEGLPRIRGVDGGLQERHVADMWRRGRRATEVEGQHYYFRLDHNVADPTPTVVFGIEQPHASGMTPQQIHEYRRRRFNTFSIDLDGGGIKVSDFAGGDATREQQFEYGRRQTAAYLDSNEFADYRSSCDTKLEAAKSKVKQTRARLEGKGDAAPLWQQVRPPRGFLNKMVVRGIDI